jgi:hypothetical protein
MDPKGASSAVGSSSKTHFKEGVATVKNETNLKAPSKPRVDLMEAEKARVNYVNNFSMVGMLESLASTLLEVQKKMQAMKAAKKEKELKSEPQLVSLGLIRKEPMSVRKDPTMMAIPEEDPGHWYGLAHGKGGRSGVYPSWAEAAPFVVGVSGALVEKFCDYGLNNQGILLYDWDGRISWQTPSASSNMESRLSLYQWYKPVPFFWTCFSLYLLVGYLWVCPTALLEGKYYTLSPSYDASCFLFLVSLKLPMHGWQRGVLLDVKNDNHKSFHTKTYWNGMYGSPCAGQFFIPVVGVTFHLWGGDGDVYSANSTCKTLLEWSVLPTAEDLLPP